MILCRILVLFWATNMLSMSAEVKTVTSGSTAMPKRQEELIFKKSSREILRISIPSMKANSLKINDKILKMQDHKLFHGFRLYKRTYRGYDFYAVMDAVYGSSWPNRSKHIRFIARDGYVQDTAVTAMLKASKGKQGLLAIGEVEESASKMVALSIFDRGSSQIDPGPVTLVWTHFPSGTQALHSDPLKWPYQLIMIDLE